MKSKNRLLTKLLVFALSLTMLLGSTVTAHAATAEEAFTELEKAVVLGQYTGITTSKVHNFQAYTYKTNGGGYYTYIEITGGDHTKVDFFIDAKFEELTASAKQSFLKDTMTIANEMVYDTKNASTSTHGVSDDTLDTMMRMYQNKAGMGSQLLATLMSETKPNYASANAIYKPFSGVVGTIMALISILVMSLLGITMALDIAYIVIPPVQMALGGDGDGQGGKDGKKGLSGLISKEARAAVKASEGGGGAGGQSGEHKAAIGIYFKYRWKGLVILGICLLYLVQGQIYNFVAWFIDLFSGFLGF